MRKLLSAIVVAAIVVLALAVPKATPVYAAGAAISYIGDIGAAQSKTAGTQLVITTTAAVSAGDDIFIAFSADYTSFSPSASDSAGNVYNRINSTANTLHIRSCIFAAYHVNALPSGSSITITHSTLTARAAVVSVFRGLMASASLDMTAVTSGTSTSPSSPAMLTTNQPDELLIGAIGTEGPYGDAAGTWQNSFVTGQRTGTTGDVDDTNVTVSMGYRIVSATGVYTASKSGITSRFWQASIATFRMDITAPTVTINQAATQPDPTDVSPINFTVVFSERVKGFAAGGVILSGTAGATTAIVSETAPNNGTTYNVAVSGMTGSGTVIASIGAGVCTDVAGNTNAASTSTDNTVTIPPWDSYQTSGRQTIDNDYASPYTTVFMHGTGFANVSYLIVYYDANGANIGATTITVSGGTLDSQYLLTTNPTAAPGTWHALVQPSSGYTAFGTHTYAEITASPATYGLAANDSFTVESSAIPEFPTVFAAISVAGLCFAVYYWMRKKRLALVKA